MQARAGAVKLLVAAGRKDEAEAKRQTARTMVDEIVGLFEDENLRAAFVESAAAKIRAK